VCLYLPFLAMDTLSSITVLTGSVKRGCSKAYSSRSLEFRDTYISIVLFQGSYIWIRFREVASKGVYLRSTQDKQGRTIHKYEPRFKPPREKGVGSSKSQIFNWIYLGRFNTYHEAEVLYRIAAFYYGKDQGQLDLGEGRFFTIPVMSEEDQSLSGMAKVEWVKVQARRVYEDFKKEKATIFPPTLPAPGSDDDNLLEELLTASEAEVQNGDGVNMGDCVNEQAGNQFTLVTSQFQQPFFADQTPNAAMDIAMQGQFAQLSPNTDNEFDFNTSNQDGLLQLLVNNQQQLINLLQQQLHESKLQKSQILELQEQQRVQYQELQNLQLQHQILELQRQQQLQ
jgi:hypothetical protein